MSASRQDRQELIEDLNGDLAGTLAAITQHITYSAKVTGRYRQRLVQFFLDGIPEEEAQARFLAQKIVALGGEPTTVPRGVPRADTNREMVEAMLDTQGEAVRDFTDRAKKAEEYGDRALATKMKDLARDLRRRSAMAKRILQDWPL